MNEKLSEKIYREVRKDILDGKYSTRDFISESQIAKENNVSKAPVKEALHILADQGYLESFPRKGYMVNTYTTEELNKVQDIRRALESLCVKLIIKNATDDEIKSLKSYEEEVDAEKSLDPRGTVNVNFHLGLAEISGNEFLPEALRTLVLRATMCNMKADADVDNFDHIVEALLARDEEKALEWLIKDIRYIK